MDKSGATSAGYYWRRMIRAGLGYVGAEMFDEEEGGIAEGWVLDGRKIATLKPIKMKTRRAMNYFG